MLLSDFHPFGLTIHSIKNVKLCSSIYRCELHNKELKIYDVMTMTQLCACPSHFNLEENISYLPLPGDDDGHGGLFLVPE